MRENCSYGSVGERGGNKPLYPDIGIVVRGKNAINTGAYVPVFARPNDVQSGGQQFCLACMPKLQRRQVISHLLYNHG